MSENKERNEEEREDFFELFSSYIRHWPTILVCCVICGFLGCFLAEWIRPTYTSDALIQVEAKSSGLMSKMGDLGTLLGANAQTETEIELVKSRSITGIVIEALNLQFEVNPVGFWDRLKHKEGRLELTRLEIPPTLFEDPKDKNKPWLLVAKDSTHYALFDLNEQPVISDAEVGKDYKVTYQGSTSTDTVEITVKKMTAEAGQRFEIRKLPLLSAITRFGKVFDIAERGKKTGILELTYTDVYPDRAAYVVNEIANVYQRSNIAQRGLEAEATIKFLNSQIPMVRNKLDSSEQALSDYRSKSGTVDMTAEAKIALETQKSLNEKLLALEQKRTETVRLFHEEHPTVKTIDEQIASLRKEIKGSSSAVKDMPEKQQEIVRLTGDVELNQMLYMNMMTNIQQLQLVAAGEVGSVRIVDRAEPAITPTAPKKNLIRFSGIFAGICLSLLIFYLKERVMNNGLKDARAIENELGYSVYAKVPRNFRDKSKSSLHVPLAIQDPTNNTIEALRTLRTSLEFSLSEGKTSVIVITGLTPGVGKSFIASNLAALFASIGTRRVLLVDADIRKGRLHKEFSFKRENGLSELLLGNLTLDAAIHKTSVENLDLLCCGKTSTNPAELFSSKQFKELVDKLRAMYDFIIFDTPPIMLVTDAMLVGRYMDHGIMVLEYGKHTMEGLKDGMTLFMKGADEETHAAFVINKYIRSQKDGYGYGYGYGYRYGSK